ncbi:4-hydroxy-tetrahydrodipicolinate reductase [Candidatus Providencia siddallii]|uniref:4-hydroxy-tetrahydrodipicolinate reductase n=1 Tax=Candidatus Providencia siddallii TaxID=1715285 RepID=A0ABP1CDT6_9GAMM
MKKSIIRIVITGAAGRMGRQLIKLLKNENNMILIAAIARKDSEYIKVDVGNFIKTKKLGVIITDSLNEIIDDFDVLIDFSIPKFTLECLSFCIKKLKPMIIGTTGFNDQEKQIIINASKIIPIVYSSNFSIGANLLLKLAEKTTKIIGINSDIEIIDLHHRNKIDSPSGTALTIGESIANALGKNLKNCISDIKNRKKGTINFTTIRAGDIVGEHTVIFANIGEQIEIIHKVSNRATFAKGAIKASNWIIDKKIGLYNMKDVLNINDL